mmetsp:Transcript_4300/g.12980  ORF Transcript_4300/g.12980 Transcript_4300/m.12980 type:complete len:191 (+) Transcript_4300:129-701(+)|eukprot:CAMPEP_0198729298 /NCGR_PEP_ID=MMETSP1475-20131203/16802_1 /TAXON_ID= ORGANISM="Unidentified sp., Strain CCMP1999" /NCGR_SAMPLE_ID=MMETSP1475 /ASSEMBLY_ACC=CAM_ASM_001111 /LENGTH=190 /DNA_ID=CAMNT_0044491903 /DNA_START=89 /DNA_END=661 /DNA_ORIENTATION=+
MKELLTTGFLVIPEGVEVEINSRCIVVKGPRGELSRDMKHMNLQLRKIEEGSKVRVDIWHAKKKQKAAMNTILSTIQNLITGVTKGYQYKMRFVYAHFPINVSVSDDKTVVEIRNFLGEKRLRTVHMLHDVSCYRSAAVKDELVLEGNDLQLVSQSAALVHQSCLVKNKDIRKFLDGIYVSAKGHVVVED